uniref:DUF4792 domain-containing protein n=1 Tax=Panagrellus redivivus TaxID=6233 RepID=A0A7E4VJS7_PANRE
MRALRWTCCVLASVLIGGVAIFWIHRILSTSSCREPFPNFASTLLSPAGKAVHLISPLPYLTMSLVQLRPTNCSSCCQSLAGGSIQIAVFGKTSLCDINLEFTEVDNITVVTTSAYQNHAGLLNKFSFDFPNNWVKDYWTNYGDWVKIMVPTITPETGIVEVPVLAENETLCSADTSRDGNVYSLYFNTELDDLECPMKLLVLGVFPETEE